LRFWEVPYKLAVLDEGGVVSTLLEILGDKGLYRAIEGQEKDVSTLLEILVRARSVAQTRRATASSFNPS
jgi:hypothetical protein